MRRGVIGFVAATVAVFASTSTPIAAGGPDAALDSGLRPHCASMATRLALPPDRGQCDPTACAKAAGVCAYAGFCFGQACVKKTHDAGWTCTDGAQCEGQACLAASGATPGPGTGTCTPGLITLGCHVYVSSGVISRGALCGD